MDEESPFLDEDEIDQRLQELAESKVRWGAMEPSPELYKMVLPREGEKLMHLGFGGKLAQVRQPREGEWYA